jgi:hypothetical protein
VKSCIKGKVAPVGRVRSPVPFLSFDIVISYVQISRRRKDFANTSNAQFKGIPSSFPILAAEIQMTMPGPNALHW